MALPAHLAEKIKEIPFSPAVISTDPTLAYILSFKKHATSNNAVSFHPRDTYQSPLSQYQYADFDDSTYQHLLEQTIKNYRSKNITVVKGVRSSFKQFYTRVAALTYESAIKSSQITLPKTKKPLETSSLQLDYRVETMKGNIPAKWPQGLKEFQNELENLPWDAFSTESQLLYQEFMSQVRNQILVQTRKIAKATGQQRQKLLRLLLEQVKILLGICLRTLHQQCILNQLSFITQTLVHEMPFLQLQSSQQQSFICSQVSHFLKNHLSQIPAQPAYLKSHAQKLNTDQTKQQQEFSLHHLDKIWDSNAFLIMKKIHFQKMAGLAYYTVTTDGIYLYVYVSAINGAMYKIGTGHHNTVPGKIYLQKPMHLTVGSKLDQVNWVCLKGKLYLKTSSKDPHMLSVINTTDFKVINSVQLSCPSLFGHGILSMINKNSILMTDGENLYFLGKRIKISHGNQPQANKEKSTKQVTNQSVQTQVQNSQQINQNNAQQNKKKKKKNNNNEPNQQQQQGSNNIHEPKVVKSLEFVLAEFSVDEDSQDSKNTWDIDQEAIQELFSSFSGYFTHKECRRAYHLNNFDVMQACQWLFDEGSKQKDKNTSILPVRNLTVLCQSEITSNFNQKNFKNPAQIVTKDGSLLHIFNVHESIWTMDKDQITCYSQNGTKIFGKHDKADNKTDNKGTHLKTLVHNRHPRNPEYCFTYDPYNHVFYTFSWHNDGHYFPCPILISKDTKEQTQLAMRRSLSVSVPQPRRVNQLQRFLLTELALIESKLTHHFKANIKNVNKKEIGHFRFNDSIWWYGQKINQLNVQSLKATPDEKRRIANKKSKLLTKINKILALNKTYQKDIEQFNRNKYVVKQVVKLYPFSFEGTLQNIRQILSAFEGVQNQADNRLIGAFIMIVQKWLGNCTITQFGQELQQKIKIVRETLLKIRNAPVTREDDKIQINKIIIRHFNIFFATKLEAIQFLTQLPADQIQIFLNLFQQIAMNTLQKIGPQKDFIVYEISKKQQICNKYDSKSDFPNIFPNKSSTKVLNRFPLITKNIFAELLLRNQSTFNPQHTKFLSFLEHCLCSYEKSVTVLRFFMNMFSQTFRNLSLSSGLELEQQVAYMERLFEDVFRILEKCLSNCSVTKTIQLTECVLFVVQIYIASVVRLLGNQNIIKSLLKIIQLIQKPEINEFYQAVKMGQFEGISAIQEKTYQTPHPLERGKSQSYPQAYYPEANLLYLQFDKRCQSDQNHDIMTIQLLHENSPIGNSMPCHDGTFSTQLRLTGKVQTEKPVLMLGNNLSVEFTSSGHAQNAQSFGRFGFKFGMRPVYGGKFLIDKNVDHAKLERIFGHNYKNGFKNFVNTMKFLVNAASMSIQGLFAIENDQSTQETKELLKGKILRQGLEQNKCQQQTASRKIQNLVKFLQKQHCETQNSIIKKSNQHLLANYKQISDQKKSVPQLQNSKTQEIWSMNGIPQYIRGYLQQIKQFKGDFVDVFKQARQHAPPQGSYLFELRRPGFLPQYKQLWLQGQALLFLTVLKHSGLLHLNLKFSIEYIKENLKAFEEARNGIFYAFISRMQIVREWRDLVETFYGKEQQEQKMEEKTEKTSKKSTLVPEKKQISIRRNNRIVRTVQLQEGLNMPRPQSQRVQTAKSQAKTPKIKSKEEIEKQRIAEVEKTIRERLNDEFRIKQICNLKKIKYVEGNIYESVSNIIETIRRVNPQDDSIKKSVYVQPIEHLIQGCMFLLNCRSPSTKESLEEDNQIVPMALARSLSSDNKNANKNKVQMFREWLQNWKKWKGFQKQNRIELKFPVLEIVQFINSWIDLKQLRLAIQKRSVICQHRIQFYKYLNQLIKLTSQNFMYNKYVYGSQLLGLEGTSCKDQLESAPVGQIQQLVRVYADYANTLKQVEGKFIQEKLPITYQSFIQRLQSFGSTVTTKNKTNKSNQTVNNNTIIGNKNQNLLTNYNYKSFFQSLRIQTLIFSLIESQNPHMSLDVALFFLNFKFLSNQCQQLLFLSSLIVQRAFNIQHKLSEILQCLRKEVGDSSIMAKRWKDLLFIERVQFLLRKVEVYIRTKPTLDIDEKTSIAQVLFYLLNLTNVPILTRMGLKLIKRLSDVSLRDTKTPFDYRYKSLKFVKEEMKLVMGENFSVENIGRFNNLEVMARKCLKVINGRSKKQILGYNNSYQRNDNQIDQEKRGPRQNLVGQETGDYENLSIESRLQKEWNKMLKSENIPSTEQVNLKEQQCTTADISKEQRYCIVLNLSQQQDLIWMLRVLFYVQQVLRKSGKGKIKQLSDWNQFQQRKILRDSKNQHKNQSRAQPPQQQQKNSKASNFEHNQQNKERIIRNLPVNRFRSVQQQLEKQFPWGWYMNYSDVFETIKRNNKINHTQTQSELRTQQAANPTSEQPQQPQKNGYYNNVYNVPAQQNPARKAWTSNQLNKVNKKFEQLAQIVYRNPVSPQQNQQNQQAQQGQQGQPQQPQQPPNPNINPNKIQQPSQTDSEQVKNQFIKALNFIHRVKKHLTQVVKIANVLSASGYMHFMDGLNKDQAVEICQIITLGAQNKLKTLNLSSLCMQITNQSYRHKLTIQDHVTNVSKLKVTLLSRQNTVLFNQMLDLQSQLIPFNSVANIDAASLLKKYTKLNQKQYILADTSYLPFQEFILTGTDQESQQEGEGQAQINSQVKNRQEMEFVRAFIGSKIFKMKKRQEEVYLPDYPKLKYFLAQGGIESGLKNATLVPASQHSLTLQTVSIEQILTQSLLNNTSNDQTQVEDQFPEELIQKLIKHIRTKILPKKSSKDNQISRKQIMNYLLMSFYLKKVTKMDLKFIPKNLLKQLAQALVEFGSLDGDFKSYQPIEHYEKEMQKLLIKFMDLQLDNLKIFEIFNPYDYDFSQTLKEFMAPSSFQQANFSAKHDNQTNQTLGTHHYPKSAYLLHTYPPQIQENQLLKYWQKNILPKIYQFVKTTLRPIQIDDFFEQMRMPLRKNDQMSAKKIAYVICDNKLPQGAVLPDSNHNWNSFTIDDIVIGQYALLKLPKHIMDAISPLVMAGNQEYRLVKVIFVDVRTSSVLVRYRIEQYALMGYLWVPINNLIRVQKQIMHFSPKDLYNQMEKNLKGMIYGYSKFCLTQLTSVSNLDETKLIKQTIVDMFINDPVAGWLGKINHEWSMKPVLKKMMKQGSEKLQILNYLEKEFCSLLSYQTDLFSDRVIRLNSFQQPTTALIVSFQKNAMLSLTSGIKFYKDPYLFSQVEHVYTTKNEKTEFQPLIFNDPNVYCQYYTNKECLKVAQQNKYQPKPIKVTVFGIQQIWTIGCYLGQVISEIAQEETSKQKHAQHLQILKRLNGLYCRWLLKKQVAVMCSYLSKLVTKITNRIIFIQKKLQSKTTLESLGIDEAILQQFITWVKEIKAQEETATLPLYSELLQNLSQMCTAFLRKTHLTSKGQSLPQHIQAMVNLSNVIQRIESHLKGEKVTLKPQPFNQWERFLEIQNIPSYIKPDTLIEKMKILIEENKGKILCPKFDLFVKNDKMIICVDGWNITELVEEQIAEKIQKQEEQQQNAMQEEEGLMMEWACAVCTFVNPLGDSHCSMCGTQMPAPPKATQVYEQVQATDVSKAQNKLKQLEAQRFQTIKEQILKFFNSYWEQHCAIIQKKNKKIQQEKKTFQHRKNKNQIKEQVQEVPAKPSVNLRSGSEILNDGIVQDFLEFRMIGFPQQVVKMVKQEPTYLEKFKKLQFMGYDLWCDHIFNQNPTLIPFEHLYQLMNYIQGEICKGSSSVLSYSENSIRILNSIPLLQEAISSSNPPINYQAENDLSVKMKYKNLQNYKSYNIRYSWKIVKELNVAASKCLQFINMNLKHYEEEQHIVSKVWDGFKGQGVKESDCLGFKVKYYRNLIMGAIKLQLNQKIIQKTSILREPEEVPKVTLERLRNRQQRNKGNKPVTLREKDEYLFTKAHQQFSKVSTAMLRPFKPKGTDPYLSFSVTFRNQLAMGQAGPYRQFFTDISAELDPKQNMGLFIPTPNNQHKTGEYRQKWTVNPKANSSYHLSLYNFIGILMGSCMRIGTHLALDLPRMFWKLLVGERITDQDLQQTDSQLMETLRMIKEIPNQQLFTQLEDYSQPMTWTYTTSDGEEHEIIHNGRNIRVTFEDRLRYVEEVKAKRASESMLQVTRIKQGLHEMMPQAYFNLLSGDQVKLMVCGRPKVDVQLLRKHTKYAGGLSQEEPRIKYFWQVMKELPQTDKLKVIKFCWGQQRLPINSEQFQRSNTRFMIKPMMNNNKGFQHDKALPKADTCFFNIELPNYSSKSVLKEKLLLAVNLDCVSINADENFNPDDNPLMNEIIEEDQYYEDEDQGEPEE